MLTIWSLVPLPCLNPTWTSGSSQFTYYWSIAWRILNITLLVCEMSAIVWLVEHSLVLPFFGIRMKIDLFQSCGHCWVFQICWHIECSTFTASSCLFTYMQSTSWEMIGWMKHKLESRLATGLEKVSFHSNPKERKWQKMLKLLHNCTHFTC